MSENKNELNWEEGIQKKFDDMIGKIPVFLREMAKNKVGSKARQNAREDSRQRISEKDMVDAFFSETPFGFHGPMKCDMEEFHIDYTQYGYER